MFRLGSLASITEESCHCVYIAKTVDTAVKLCSQADEFLLRMREHKLRFDGSC